jgi:hypothetical protein
MLGSAFAHAARSRLVLKHREAVLEAHRVAAKRRLQAPVVVVALGTSEVGRQIVAHTGHEPTVLVMTESELLLSFVQSRRDFFHRLTALVTEHPHVDGRVRVLVCAEGGLELSVWTDQLEPVEG